MNRTISSVLVVFFALFAALGGTWVYVRSRAVSKPVKTPFAHPFLDRAHAGGHPILFARISKPSELIVKTGPAPFNVGVWLDVRMTGDGSLVVSREELLTSGPAKGKPLEISTAEEWKNAGILDLETFAKTLRQEKVPTVLNLIARRPGLAKRLLEVWKTGGPIPVEDVVVQSESDGILKELRDAEAKGLFGTSQATLIQIEMLSNIGLEGLIDLRSDVIISSMDEKTNQGRRIPRIRESTLAEAHRRGLRRYAGPTSDAETARKLLSEGYDGVMFESRDALETLIR